MCSTLHYIVIGTALNLLRIITKCSCIIVGTLLYAADDVLNQLEAERHDKAVKPEVYHDTVSLVKSLWALSHKKRYESATNASADVQHPDMSISDRVQRVRSFWAAAPVKGKWYTALTAASTGKALTDVQQIVLENW
jgi:hypothetical protein